MLERSAAAAARCHITLYCSPMHAAFLFCLLFYFTCFRKSLACLRRRSGFITYKILLQIILSAVLQKVKAYLILIENIYTGFILKTPYSSSYTLARYTLGEYRMSHIKCSSVSLRLVGKNLILK